MSNIDYDDPGTTPASALGEAEQLEVSPGGTCATWPPRHHGDLDEDRPHK